METYDTRSEEPQIDGYDINRYLGAGGNSSVWVIIDPKTGDELVLKTLGYDEALRRTGIRAPELRHEFLVEEVAFVQTSQGPGLVMEYCPAGSAAAVVASRGPMSVGEVLTVIAPLGEALEFLHDRGITHGDVSPRNILFTAEGKPKLADFGTQTMRGQSQSDYGTSGFCAPEVSDPATLGILEPARDVYALAACTWYLLTGRAPASTVNRIPIGAMVPEVNDEFAQLLEDALAIDPALRPSAAEFTQRIFVAGTPTAVELGDAVASAALKHMLTTKQVDHRSLRVRIANLGVQRGNRKATRHAKKLGKRASQPQAPDVQEMPENEQQWANAHKIHSVPGSRKKFTIAVALGVALVLTGGYAAQNLLLGEPKVAASALTPEDSSETNPNGQDAPLRANSDEEVLLAAARLTLERDRILMSGQSAALEQIYYPGSEAQKRDLQMLALMKQKNLKLGSLKTVLSEARVIASSATSSLIVEALSAQDEYNYKDNSGRVILSSHKTQRQRVLIELRQYQGTWKIWNVSTAGEAAA
ncbi:hypothetical protein CQ018_00685 [Arthrobacter sp. MYb227]|uniref:serine/threonine protein kinase n=1 Tax=Arthrobacter sp. MYb227 TaxID=1848601 RepID=UPI000CFBC364|nr:protein kinase [Arthrobacter sp. MYb227]PQZ95848.1 hypothetical protein CQ018_00685 [Arthrobacter sp. MYb227]